MDFDIFEPVINVPAAGMVEGLEYRLENRVILLLIQGNGELLEPYPVQLYCIIGDHFGKLTLSRPLGPDLVQVNTQLSQQPNGVR